VAPLRRWRRAGGIIARKHGAGAAADGVKIGIETVALHQRQPKRLARGAQRAGSGALRRAGVAWRGYGEWRVPGAAADMPLHGNGGRRRPWRPWWQAWRVTPKRRRVIGKMVRRLADGWLAKSYLKLGVSKTLK